MASGRPSSLLPQTRHHRNPFAASPLQINFPANDTSDHDPISPALQQTPSRTSRMPELEARSRSPSHSASVPVRLQVTGPRSQASSPQLRENKRSVKHLTCFWWKEKGFCRLSDEECLYAHYDTGRYTDAPRQVLPGEPAKAGKSLDRALKNLALTSHKSSVSLSSQTHSRPITPGLEIKSAPSDRSLFDFGTVQSDAVFLRSLVEQSNDEKAIMVSTIHDLRNDKVILQSVVEQLQNEKDRVIKERDALRAVVNLQQQHRSLSTPFGAIGSDFNNSDKSPLAWTPADARHLSNLSQ